MTPNPTHSIREFEQGYEEHGRLLGFRSACGFVTATWGLACPRCGARDLVEHPLSKEGRIAAFTVQTVPSDEFLDDAPYAYVVVDLDGGGRISGWMAGVRAESELTVGDRVHFAPGYRRGIQFERGGAEVRDA
ncbi:MAG TPA: OB-fold domain-containing protein [Thermoplasmata archaeon]|nr:OB-fold domain-containing protein [Thermoplasmata archaeon]